MSSLKIQEKITQIEELLKEIKEENDHLVTMDIHSYHKLRDDGHEIEELRDRLEKAEKVIEFYGDTDNYMELYYENYGLIEESDELTCGERAREYFKGKE